MQRNKNQYQMETIHPSKWSRTQLNFILSQAKGKKILVIGDVGVDRYTIGNVERISPEAPVPIVQVQEERLKLGLAANVADNIQTLEGIPYLVGIVGRDREAADFRKLLQLSGIKSNHLVIDKSRRTSLKERIVSDRQQVVRVDYESIHNIDHSIEENIIKKINNILPHIDGIIIEDYAKGMITQNIMTAILNMAKKYKKKVALDPNLKTPVHFYRDVYLLTPNTKEAEFLSGITIRDTDALIKAGITILKLTRASFVVITLGKDGMAVFSKKSSVVQLIPTYAREVYDVSGAGDTVISVLMLALISGAKLEDAAILGNLAAGVEVGKKGTATVSIDEIKNAIEFFSKAPM